MQISYSFFIELFRWNHKNFWIFTNVFSNFNTQIVYHFAYKTSCKTVKTPRISFNVKFHANFFLQFVCFEDFLQRICWIHESEFIFWSWRDAWEILNVLSWILVTECKKRKMFSTFKYFLCKYSSSNLKRKTVLFFNSDKKAF